jgi:protein-L-isoaspartate(D-aspartate) O-methyltransferase
MPGHEPTIVQPTGVPGRLRAIHRGATLSGLLLVLALAACAPSPVPLAPAGTTSPPQVLPGGSTGSLDRVLGDTDADRDRRDLLVDAYVAPLIDDQRVVDAMRAVPRHAFVPSSVLDEAYNDYPLPIGYGQTISQPSLVAMMTEQLELDPGERVLEIGTGSGYQAAILRELTDHVFSVEIIPELSASAGAVLAALGYGDVQLDRRDGYFGWPEHGPFDAIIVTAAPDHLPSPLADQLAPGGRMIIPIGPQGDVQTLWLVTREGGEVQMERLLSVQFVPLTRVGA